MLMVLGDASPATQVSVPVRVVKSDVAVAVCGAVLHVTLAAGPANPLRSTVSVTLGPFSFTETVGESNWMVPSKSPMVMVWAVGAPRVAPVGLERLTVNAREAWTPERLVIGIEIVF